MTRTSIGADASIPYLSEGNHPIFREFRRWEGTVEGGWDVNWLGVKTRASYYDVMTVSDEARHVTVPPLPFDEEYFEWIDLLEAVSGAGKRFTMLELGAGWGRWIVNAAAALHQLGRDDYRLIAVEGEPQHFEWLKQHIVDNGIDLAKVELIHGAVAGSDGVGRFEIGDASSYYGQTLAGLAREESKLRRLLAPIRDKVQRSQRGARLARIRALSLETLLEDIALVDLIDADVQSAEADVFEPAAATLENKVRRVHIETHNEGVEPRLRDLFTSLGWTKVWDFPCASDSATPYGTVHFEGGVQSWVNPRLWSPAEPANAPQD